MNEELELALEAVDVAGNCFTAEHFMWSDPDLSCWDFADSWEPVEIGNLHLVAESSLC